MVSFPYLLLPSLWSSRNRVRRRERGDSLRALLFGAIGLLVGAAIFGGSFWLTWQLDDYAELGDYLLRLGLSWLFMTFLSFLAFSGVVTALSTFFLSEDLRLLIVAPVAVRRLFHARFLRTVVQASWMVVIFLVPVLMGVGLARCSGPAFYLTAMLAVVPFVVIPVALGTAVTLLLVNIFPARRARDILFLMGLLFAASLVLLLRFIQPERLLNVESLPDVTDFFATLQSPVTPMLPSFWAGEVLFASLRGGRDWLHAGALWTTALAMTLLLRAANERWYFSGFSKAQEARKARFTQLRGLDRLARALPISVVRRHLLIKDVKIFMRDVSQWSQLLLLCALVMVYLYNFRVLDLERIPYMSGVIKNVYAFVNLGMAGLVMATVAVRFVFPAVSAEGAAYWIIRTAPISLHDFLWSKFWTGLVPVLVLTEGLTIVANEFMGIDPFLKVVAAATVVFMSFALVGLATGLGARYPRFGADNANQVAGSYGGVAFMIVAVLFVLTTIGLIGWPSSAYLFLRLRRAPLGTMPRVMMAACFLTAAAMSVATWWLSMRAGVKKGAVPLFRPDAAEKGVRPLYFASRTLRPDWYICRRCDNCDAAASLCCACATAIALPSAVTAAAKRCCSAYALASVSSAMKSWLFVSCTARSASTTAFATSRDPASRDHASSAATRRSRNGLSGMSSTARRKYFTASSGRPLPEYASPSRPYVSLRSGSSASARSRCAMPSSSLFCAASAEPRFMCACALRSSRLTATRNCASASAKRCLLSRSMPYPTWARSFCGRFCTVSTQRRSSLQ